MSVQTQNTNLNPYSSTPIKNLEYIQNKALVIAPFEINKSGSLDTDLMLDTPGAITMYLYKKIVAGEDKEPTADQFKTIKTMSDLVLSGLNNEVLISTFKIPVIFKYDKVTGIRTIEKDNKDLSGTPLDSEYTDLVIDVSDGDLSSETGSGGFFCVCQVQKIQKSVATTTFSEVANDEFLFMIPSAECREIPELVEFDLLDSDNNIINIKKYGLVGGGFIKDADTSKTPYIPETSADFFGDGSNIATYLFDGNVRDENLTYNGTATNITYGLGKFGQAAVFNGTTSEINTTLNPVTSNIFSFSIWFNPTDVTTLQRLCGFRNDTLGWQFGIANNSATISRKSDGYGYLVSYNPNINSWNHLVIISNGTSLVVYLNGVLISTVNTLSLLGYDLNFPKNVLRFGVQSNYIVDGVGQTIYPRWYSGSLDNVRIFNRVLTPDEVSALYNNIPNQFVIKQEQEQDLKPRPDFFKDGSNIATYLFNGDVKDANGVNNGTATGITYGPGKFGQAAIFSGASNISWVAMKSWDGVGDFSISLWVNKDRALGDETIFGRYSSDYSTSGTLFGLTTGENGSFDFSNEYGSALYISVDSPANSLKIGEWSNIVLTFSGNSTYLYHNGILVSQSTSSNWLIGARVKSASLLHLGQTYIPDAGTSHNMFKGKMDNVRIFNRALNQNEVTALYNEQPSIEEQYKLVEETGKTPTIYGNPLILHDAEMGPSIKFNGVLNEYIQIPTSPDLDFSNDITFECMIKPNGYPTSGDANTAGIIGTVGTWTTGAWGMNFGTQSWDLSKTNRLLLWIYATEALTPTVYSSFPLTIGVWYHIALVQTGSTIKLYINGILDSTSSGTKKLTINPAVSVAFFNRLNGNVKNIIITKGAKYTSNFIPSYNPEKTDSTVLLLHVTKPSFYSGNVTKVQLLTNETIPAQGVTNSIKLKDYKLKDPFGDKSMVACYLLDSNTKDETGFYNGTGTGITYTDGRFSPDSKAAIFNGEAYIDSNIKNNSSAFSITTWINVNQFPIEGGDSEYVISKFWGTNDQLSIQLGYPNTLSVGLWTSTLLWNGVTFTVETNKWYHVVANFLSDKIQLYIDGILIGEKLLPSTIVYNTTVSLGIGKLNRNGSPDPRFKFKNGQLSNVKIFNRALTSNEVVSLYTEPNLVYTLDETIISSDSTTKNVEYTATILESQKLYIDTNKDINSLGIKTWSGSDATKQGYRIHPILKINDHITLEDTFSPKYYLGAKYQRNLMEVLAPALKSKRTISNLKDMYLVDDLCIQTLKKINILLENNQMIKLTERLYSLGTPLREKLNADLILEYLSTPVTGSVNSDIATTLKTSLIEDYHFTQEEIDNLNDNLNTFKSRARISLATPTIDNDKFRFNLPKTFIDGNRSKTEKKNLLVFGTDAGFNKFGLSGYSAPYSNISKRDTSEVLDMNGLTLGLPMLEDLNAQIISIESANGWDSLLLNFSNNKSLIYDARNINEQLPINYGADFIAINSDNNRYPLIVKDNIIQLNTLPFFNIPGEIVKFGGVSFNFVLCESGNLYRMSGVYSGNSIPTLIATNINKVCATSGINYKSYYSFVAITNDGTLLRANNYITTYWPAANIINDFPQNSSFFGKLIDIKEYSGMYGVLNDKGDLFVMRPNSAVSTAIGNTQNRTFTKIQIPNVKYFSISLGGNLFFRTETKSYVIGYRVTDNSSDDTTIREIDSSIEDQFVCMYTCTYKQSGNWFSKILSGAGVGTYPRSFGLFESGFKDILSNYKQQIPFTYIPLSTDPANTNNEPVFENLTDITGFGYSDIIIDVPNVL